VSVVIPAHNEEGNVGPLMDQFADLAKSSRFNFEVVLVDDGSTDRTLARATDVQKRHRFIRLVSLPYRRGLTEALRAGFAVARGGIIVFYPADRQFHPNDIPKMVDKVREGFDLVTGRKIGEYDKKVVSGAYNRISRMLFPSIPVTDLNSVKAFRRELIDVFDYRHDWHRFWVAIVSEAGYRVGEVDVTLYKRRAGKSKFGFWRIPGGVLDLLAVKFQYHTMRRPLWYFGMTGSFLLAAAFVLGVYAIYDRIVNDHGYRPLLFLIMMLGITGIVFFTLGFLAESVAGIREQLKSLRGSPRYNVHPALPDRSSSGRSASRSSSESTSERSRGSSRTSSDSRSRRRGSDDRRSRQSPRRSSQRRGSESSQDDSDAGKTSIRRRKLESGPRESPAASSDDAPKSAEAESTLPDNDLFSGGEEAKRDNRESKDSRPSSPDAPASAETPSFGRRNRR
jgi:glycosyltransferase involved in cell wall biosynthesis